jgi:hypothetical protein
MSRFVPDASEYLPAAWRADQDHTNVEENNRAAAIAWVRDHM